MGASSGRDRMGGQAPLDREALERILLLGERMANLVRLGGAIFHEVRGPLQTILVALETLRRTGGGVPDSSATIEAAEAEVERLGGLFEALFDFVRGDTEGPKPEDINQLVSGILGLLAKDLRKAGIEVRAELEPIPACAVDRQALHFVLVSLIENARDAMVGVGGRLELGTKGRPEGGVEIRIEDTGRGMAPGVLERAFEPFFTTKGTGAGTGLGLGLARSVVEKMGGTLRVESAPGRGTSVRIGLPGAGEKDGHVSP